MTQPNISAKIPNILEIRKSPPQLNSSLSWPRNAKRRGIMKYHLKIPCPAFFTILSFKGNCESHIMLGVRCQDSKRLVCGCFPKMWHQRCDCRCPCPCPHRCLSQFIKRNNVLSSYPLVFFAAVCGNSVINTTKNGHVIMSLSVSKIGTAVASSCHQDTKLCDACIFGTSSSML